VPEPVEDLFEISQILPLRQAQGIKFGTETGFCNGLFLIKNVNLLTNKPKCDKIIYRDHGLSK